MPAGVGPWDSFCAGHFRAEKVLSCIVIIIAKYLLILHFDRSGISLLFRMCTVMGINVHPSRINRDLGIKCNIIPFLL